MDTLFRRQASERPARIGGAQALSGTLHRTHHLALDCQGSGVAEPGYAFDGGRIEHDDATRDGWLRVRTNDLYGNRYSTLECDQCGVRLPRDELRRESLDILGQELLELIVRERAGFVCPQCAGRGVIGVMWVCAANRELTDPATS